MSIADTINNSVRFAAAECLQHVVGRDGKNCRNCGISAAWIAEANLRRGSAYEVPGSHPRKRVHTDCDRVWLSGQRVPLHVDDWIEVVW